MHEPDPEVATILPFESEQPPEIAIVTWFPLAATALTLRLCPNTSELTELVVQTLWIPFSGVWFTVIESWAFDRSMVRVVFVEAYLLLPWVANETTHEPIPEFGLTTPLFRVHGPDAEMLTVLPLAAVAATESVLP